jgi:hypothetical protein
MSSQRMGNILYCDTLRIQHFRNITSLLLSLASLDKVSSLFRVRSCSARGRLSFELPIQVLRCAMVPQEEKENPSVPLSGKTFAAESNVQFAHANYADAFWFLRRSCNMQHATCVFAQ